MKIWSNDFPTGGKIGSVYTCDGEGTSPSLVWSDVPAGTRSLALIMDDPDIPQFVKDKMKIEKFDHWVIFNIPPEVKGIVPDGTDGMMGQNSAGKNEYTGPCPPDREHRYFFRLYALDATMDLRAGATADDLMKAMEGHIVEKAELVGLYERIKK